MFIANHYKVWLSKRIIPKMEQISFSFGPRLSSNLWFLVFHSELTFLNFSFFPSYHKEKGYEKY